MFFQKSFYLVILEYDTKDIYEYFKVVVNAYNESDAIARARKSVSWRAHKNINTYRTIYTQELSSGVLESEFMDYTV